ncbi:MAG: branched-chain amino acid ABC transporter permease [Firmicutes bacterium]|nr:branched-chain amino acid ABC transporter permease [Bacillota bacterium]
MSSFYQGILVFTALNVMIVAGLYLLMGVTGLVSFGHAGFMAIGAYASALLMLNLRLPSALAWAGGTLVSVLVALVIGYPTLRLRREYFVLATMGVGEAIRALVTALPGITGGAVGLPGIPLSAGPWAILLLAAASLALVRNFVRSKYGRNCIALMSDPLAAEAMAIDTFWYKQAAFAISAGLAGLAGALFAHYITYIEPNMFGWNRSAELVTIVFFGGLQSLTGGVMATVFITTLPEILRFAAAWRFVIYAVAILVVILYRPGGLCGNFEVSWEWLGQLAARVRRERREPS